ncbi:hypothetical protein [Maribacter sp. 2307ULW6-5]|uniref:hypothetical protein n=1 Tax=Maribacter sp. 2307ULW6-5 TaxID=3386275 RepID=UPI0039BD2C4A
MRRSSGFLFALFALPLTAQEPQTKALEGRVTSKDGDVAATHVLNSTTKRATITDLNGFFSIPARLNDTLVFSAVQYKKKRVVVTEAIYGSKLLSVPLEPSLTALEEVTVTPYNLTGDMARDMKRLGWGKVYTASTLGLPNAYAKKFTQSERLLREASKMTISGNTSGMGAGGSVSLNPIINGITGRTKMLRKRVKRDRLYARTERVRAFFPDSIYIQQLGLPQRSLDDFFYFCEVDTTFQGLVDSRDRMKLWEFLKRKSALYRDHNALD